jgi:hypothetical protein
MQNFSLYAIYGLALEWGQEEFDLKRLPFDVMEGIRIEDASTLIPDGAFEFMKGRISSDDIKELQDTHYAIVHRFDAKMTHEKGVMVQEHDHMARSEQLVRKIAACLRLIRPMRQSATFMQGVVREDGTLAITPFQSPANLMEVPDVQMSFRLRDRDANELRIYAPGFVKAMDENVWKFKMAVQFHELGHWADKDEYLKARYLLWASAIESIYTSHNFNHQGSRVATARIKWFLGKDTPIYAPGDLSDLLTDPHITVGSIVDDLYTVRNYLSHGDRIPDHYFTKIMRQGFGGSVCAYAVLFEAQSFIIRTSLLKILRNGLFMHFADARSAEVYFENQGLTKDKLRSRP